MTTYTLNGTPGNYDWSDPTSWLGGVVPNAPDADVVIPVITTISTGQPATTYVNLDGSFAIRSLAVNGNSLTSTTTGTLTVSGKTISNGSVSLSTLLVGSLLNQGSLSALQITSSGAVTNSGSIGQYSPYSTPTVSQTINAASLSNTGSISQALIETPAGRFANFVNGTLTGGTYEGIGLNVGGLVTTLAATLGLFFDPTVAGYQDGPTDEEYDPASGTYVPIESTLRTVASSGSLSIGQSYTTSALTIDGSLDASRTTVFKTNQLTVDAGGTASLNGTVTGTVTDNGVIETFALYQDELASVYQTSAPLVINGSVSGSGTLEIGAAIDGMPDSRTTLELKGGASVAVVFENGLGTLTLDQPTTFTGTILPAGSGDLIDLQGVSFASITSETYAGNAFGGTLTLGESNGSAVSLRFVGNYAVADFVLSNGQVYSTSPPSLDLTVRVPTRSGDALYVDGSQGEQILVGTGNPNFISTSQAAGTGTVVVDLVKGVVAKGGQTDALLTNIQGMQLGADTSEVFGLTSGTDLIYGGSGIDTIHGNGATDYIQGGTGTNLIFGGAGNEIFYGNGGSDVMRGGSAANFMSGGSTPQSTDVFYGTGGRDFVYGNGGAVDLVGGTGSEFLSAGSGFNEIDDRQQPAGTPNVGLSQLVGSTGIDLFYGGIGTNLIVEGSGTDTFVGSSGSDTIDGGSGRSFTYAGSGTDVVNTGAGNDYVKAGTGKLTFNDTAANLQAGRFDFIDNFSGSRNTDLYLPTAVAGATSFVSQNGGTAVLTAVGGGTAEIFAPGADAGTVQAHTHFTL